jgi:hypothetical protein
VDLSRHDLEELGSGDPQHLRPGHRHRKLRLSHDHQGVTGALHAVKASLDRLVETQDGLKASLDRFGKQKEDDNNNDSSSSVLPQQPQPQPQPQRGVNSRPGAFRWAKLQVLLLYRLCLRLRELELPAVDRDWIQIKDVLTRSLHSASLRPRSDWSEDVRRDMSEHDKRGGSIDRTPWTPQQVKDKAVTKCGFTETPQGEPPQRVALWGTFKWAIKLQCTDQDAKICDDLIDENIKAQPAERQSQFSVHRCPM